jgi:hypothetical protein
VLKNEVCLEAGGRHFGSLRINNQQDAEPASLGLAQGPLLCGSSSMLENLRREEVSFTFPSLYSYFLVIG